MPLPLAVSTQNSDAFIYPITASENADTASFNWMTTVSEPASYAPVFSGGIPTSYYIQLLLTMSVLIVILVIALKLTRFLHTKKYTGDIQVVDRLAIDQNVALLLVEMDDRQYFLSLSNKNVTVLDKFKKVPYSEDRI